MTENVNVYNLLQRWNKLYETITVRCLFSVRVRVMVLNATFNNISVILWRSVLWVEENGVPGENH